MKRALLLLSILICVTTFAREQFVDSISKYPVRIVGPYKFDLSKSSKGWKRISAVYVRRSPAVLGWVVRGTIDGTNATFVLKNPPQTTYNTYAALKAQYDALLAEYTAAEKAHRQSRQISFQSRELQEQLQSEAPERDTGLETLRQRRLQQAIDDHQRDVSANDAKYDHAEALLEQIKDFETRGFDLQHPFHFTIYGVKTVQTIEGMPVYDTGVVYR